MDTIKTITKSRVILFHNTRSNNARFMHKLCLSLHAMNRLMREEAVYMASKTLLDSSSRVLFLSLKAKSG